MKEKVNIQNRFQRWNEEVMKLVKKAFEKGSTTTEKDKKKNETVDESEKRNKVKNKDRK